MSWSITKGAISSPLDLWGLDSGTWKCFLFLLEMVVPFYRCDLHQLSWGLLDLWLVSCQSSALLAICSTKSSFLASWSAQVECLENGFIWLTIEIIRNSEFIFASRYIVVLKLGRCLESYWRNPLLFVLPRQGWTMAELQNKRWMFYVVELSLIIFVKTVIVRNCHNCFWRYSIPPWKILHGKLCDPKSVQTNLFGISALSLV